MQLTYLTILTLQGVLEVVYIILASEYYQIENAEFWKLATHYYEYHLTAQTHIQQ